MALVERYQQVEQAIEILSTLVAFDTTSRNSNLELIGWVKEKLTAAGARVRMTFDDEGRKANLLASFGPKVAGGVVLSGHTDTVPVDGQDWTADPYTLREDEDRLYGRGVADMKGFIACCLASAVAWSAARLTRPIHIALSYDEEVGCLGVPRMVDDLMTSEPAPSIAIVGEPTGMRIAATHRGYLAFETVYHGKAAHSSDPGKGVSAIAAASRFVGLMQERQRAAGEVGDGSTYNVGMISGGTNINIIPCRCQLSWEIRPGANADLDVLRGETGQLVARSAEDTSFETREIFTILPLRPSTETKAVDLAQAAGASLPIVEIPFGTEGGVFQQAGIETVICGPGSINQAHQPDEWIAIDQISQCMNFIDGVRKWAES